MRSAAATSRNVIQSYIDKETNGTCPNCGDELSATIGNLQPTWSDHYDNVVCYWCKCHPFDGYGVCEGCERSDTLNKYNECETCCDDVKVAQ